VFSSFLSSESSLQRLPEPSSPATAGKIDLAGLREEDRPSQRPLQLAVAGRPAAAPMALAPPLLFRRSLPSPKSCSPASPVASATTLAVVASSPPASAASPVAEESHAQRTATSGSGRSASQRRVEGSRRRLRSRARESLPKSGDSGQRGPRRWSLAERGRGCGSDSRGP
jgi:hypothetical protein